jgi:ribosomal protein L11 methyltransferase
MALAKVALTVAGVARARHVCDRLGQAEPPPALAVTMFEEPATQGWRIEAYYDTAPDPALVLAALHGIVDAGTALHVEPVPDANWVALSQAALPPVAAGRFIIHGSHDRDRVGQRLTAIEIDAGEAFGTAHHATTRSCLEALSRIAGRRAFRRVLDLGCGSGVLAIAAARLLPAARITASDADADAVRVTRANLAANRARGRISTVEAASFAHPALRGSGRFDLIVANILAGPLVTMAPALRVALAPAGVAILSGILCEQAREVSAAYRTAGLALVEVRIESGWATLTLVRRR